MEREIVDRCTVFSTVVGSIAYGTNTPESDIDIKGIFVYPTEKILSLNKGKETINRNNPDIEYHEVEKFIRLASKCNPTILEMLYLDKYSIVEPEAKLLIDNRSSFLSVTIYKSYGGYALSQAKKLYIKGMNFTRYEKHSRHCFRLLLQGKQLLETGNLNVKIDNPEELFNISKLSPEDLINKFEEEFKEFDKIKTDLPPLPNYEKINEILLKIREMNYENCKTFRV